MNRPFHAAWIWAFISLAALAFAPGVSTAAQVVRIKSKTANVRSGPGTRFKKVWTAPQNYPYRVIKRRGRWLKVRDYEGYKDWVHKGLTDGKHAVIVKVKSANIR
ncbi:MAG: SH3 domain-containing protein, partial [Nitrospinota bacterium]|nr:SH3 domain-containing protein [Nitrospinota bacterium]